jgi:acyl transferase domain-containing protein
MDPQNRLLLETAFETFENAGYSIDKMAGSDTGVYVGCWSHDYQMHLARDPENAPTHESTGTSSAIVSNRISYFFDLKGPSMTVDTACSASLVALHQAVLSLRSGETKQCFIAGVNLLLDPTSFMALGRMR